MGHMGRAQRMIEELRTFERLCIKLAAEATMPEERAGLIEMGANYRAQASRCWTQFRTQRRKYRTELG
jgi:hypothetical protein